MEINWKLFLSIGFILSLVGLICFIVGDIKVGRIIIYGKNVGIFSIPLFPLAILLKYVDKKQKESKR